LRDRRGFSTDHAARYAACHWSLAGAAGTTYALELEGPKGRKKVNLTCATSGGAPRMIGPAVFPAGLTSIGKRDAYGKLAPRIGYVLLSDCAAELPGELDDVLTALGPLDGLVLDMRANNGGGTDHDEVFARFLHPGETWKQYKAGGRAHFSGAMVVLVDAGTRSTGETIAGMFKEDGRAYMIGPAPTAGMSAQKTEVQVPSGLLAVRFATGSNKQRFNGGKGIEGLGVAPHEIVAWDAKQLAAGVDPVLARAAQLLEKGFPKGVVPYVPHAADEKGSDKGDAGGNSGGKKSGGK